MKLNDNLNASQSFAFVDENREIIKKIFPLTKHVNFYKNFFPIFNEIKKFLNPAEIKPALATQPKEENQPSSSKSQKRKRTKKKNHVPTPEASNRNRFFHRQSKSYSDEDIIKLLKYHHQYQDIKPDWLKIGSVIPFNELTDRFTEELSSLKDEKYSALILLINCGRYHAFLYVERNPDKNPKFIYFDLRENIPKNLYKKITNLFPNSEIINVRILFQMILKASTSNLETIKEPKKYDSLLIYFIDHYKKWHGELIYQPYEEYLESIVEIANAENQYHLLKTPHNTPSMNNTS